MAFVSRHEPTQDQIDLARIAGYELVCVGDVYPFRDEDVLKKFKDNAFKGIVAGSWLSIKAYEKGFAVGVFEERDCATKGEKPWFRTTHLHITEKDIDWFYTFKE